MTRKIIKQISYEADLVLLTPLHIGGANANIPGMDMPLARNGSGEYYIPGTSIAGVLRSWYKKAYPNREGYELFGTNEDKKKEEDKKKNGYASLLYIEDAPVTDTVTSEVRDGVGIDRYFGNAADKAKFDTEVLPAGTKFHFSMIVEFPKHRAENMDVEQARIAHMLSALMDEKGLSFGRSKTRGLGRVRIAEKVRVRELDFSSKDKILSSLTNKGEGQLKTAEELIDQYASEGDNSPNLSSNISIRVIWTQDGPVMVKSDEDYIEQENADGSGDNKKTEIYTIPLLSSKDGKNRMVIPGSSIKGVMRSHCERILSTLFDTEMVAPGSEEERETFQEQVEKHELIQRLFGVAADHNKEKTDKSNLGQGALSVADCYANEPFNAGAAYKAMHVGIDRWTGGAAEGFLYGVLESFNTNWGEIEFNIDAARFADGAFDNEEARASIALLFLALRDFENGYIPLGFGGNRGLGAVNVEKIMVSGLNALPGFKGEEDEFELDFTALPHGFEEIEESWKKYLEEKLKANEQALDDDQEQMEGKAA